MSLSPLGYSTSEYIGAAADARLLELGLNPGQLVAAIRRGDEARRAASPLAPRTFPGQAMWAGCVAGLRENLLPLGSGWRPDSGRNFETATNDGLGIAIAVVGGDSRTGRAGLPYAATARPRGPISLDRVSRNRELPEPLPGFRVAASDVRTWFLLVRGSASVIRAELSLPTNWARDSIVDQWAERILLPEIEAVGAITPDGDDVPSAPVVNISRK